MTPDKKVKILATLDPVTAGIDDVRKLVEAGVPFGQPGSTNSLRIEH